MRRILVGLSVGLLSFSGVAHGQTLAGVTAASGMEATTGGSGGNNLNPAQLAAKAIPKTPTAGESPRTMGGGSPAFPSMSLGAPSAASTAPAAVHVDNATGSELLNELLSHHHVATHVAARRHRRIAVRHQSARARRIARSIAARRAALAHKYRVPARGWLSYYLPEDRYKVSSRQWKYVSVEDDPGDYPVHYYYDPASPSMLSLLSRRPHNGQPRANKVIGFRDWQDAMRAGYRPDPVSLPEPAHGLVFMASLDRGPELERYVEYIYAGQVAPDSFASSLIYTQRVAKIIDSRSDTRPLMAPTMAKVYGAFIGQNELPTSVGESQAMAVRKMANGGARGGAPGNLTPAGADKREDDFNNFSNKAGSLANVPANNP